MKLRQKKWWLFQSIFLDYVSTALASRKVAISTAQGSKYKRILARCTAFWLEGIK